MRVITYSCDNPDCRIILNNPDKCPFCGCKEISVFEDYEEEDISTEEVEDETMLR